jgi:hypothetical protein
MNPRRVAVVPAGILLLGASASAHRLDEYLQAAMFSVEKDRVQVGMRLTPGIAVSSFLLSGIDTNADGVISETEQRAYAERVLRDVSLTMDGEILRPKLISVEFPAIEEMKEGLGEIRIEFSADLPRGGPNRRVIFENRHQRRIAAYLVNCLVPSDPDIRIVAQYRNATQSFYQLDYAQAGVSSSTLLLRWQDGRGWLGIAVLVLFARFAFLWRRRRLAVTHVAAA